MKQSRDWVSTDDSPMNNGYRWLDEDRIPYWWVRFSKQKREKEVDEEVIDENEEDCFDNEKE